MTINRDVIQRHMQEMVDLSHGLAGHLTDREVRFLALTAAVLPPALGEVLEIGSFKGKSTTLLARSVKFGGGDRVVAVDPLTLPSVTDPSHNDAKTLPDQFWATLDANGVRNIVEFHQSTSQKLALAWDRSLRLLWIDGDHTYEGALADFDNFSKYLRPGSVVAFHDVLHGFEGPIRTFCERVLLSRRFGPCGVCGSIGWAQCVGESVTGAYASRKIALYRKLSRLIPFVALDRSPRRAGRNLYKIMRSLVPHGDQDASLWLAEIAGNLPDRNGG